MSSSGAGLLGFFNHAPSLSTRLLVSMEARFPGACSTMEVMLLALRERREILGGGDPMLITEDMLLLTE
jgi:hypothetical protein